MSPTTREVLKGVVGGAGFLFSALLLDVPLPLAALLGAGLFVSLGLMLPKPAATATVPAAPGLSTEERDHFLSTCRKSAGELNQLATSLTNQTFADSIRELTRVAGELLNYLEKKPEGILVAHSIPQYLEHLA